MDILVTLSSHMTWSHCSILTLMKFPNLFLIFIHLFQSLNPKWYEEFIFRVSLTHDCSGIFNAIDFVNGKLWKLLNCAVFRCLFIE